MIDPQMPVVPVCGPVAVVSWWERKQPEVRASELPPEVARLLPDQDTRGQPSLQSVFIAIGQSMQSHGAMYASPVCAVLPLRQLPGVFDMLDCLHDSGYVHWSAATIRLMPDSDVIGDVESLVSLGLMTREDAAEHIQRQARLWGKLARTIRARVLLARLGRPLKMMDDPCRWRLIGSQMISMCQDDVPWTDPMSISTADAPKSTGHDRLGWTPEVTWTSEDSVVQRAWARPEVRLGRIAVTDYGLWRTIIRSAQAPPAVTDLFRQRFVNALLLPIGCASLLDAARCVLDGDSIEGEALERLDEQAQIWREAWQAMRNGTSSIAARES